MTTKKLQADWTQVRLAYVHSIRTMASIAEEFGLSTKAVEKRAEREEWVRLRREASDHVGKLANARMEEERATELATWNQSDLILAKSLRGQVSKSIIAAQGNGVALTPAQIRALVTAAEGVQRIGRLALGATTENTGLSSPDGGPIEGSTVPVEEYEHAMRRVLSDFVAPGSLAE